MVDRKASQVYVVDDVPADGDAVTWDASLRQWVPRAGGGLPAWLTLTDGDPAFGGGDLFMRPGGAPGIDFFASEHWDGAGGPSGSGLNAQSGYTNSGSVYYQAADTTYLQVQANQGQTVAVLNITDQAVSPILEVTGDRKIGFYAAAPVAQQTGVAVSDAAIHAALVNLGLITA